MVCSDQKDPGRITKPGGNLSAVDLGRFEKATRSGYTHINQQPLKEASANSVSKPIKGHGCRKKR